MSNLHDISWGNRPATSGTEMLAADAQKQQKLKANYMVFRTNFLLFWIVANTCYAMVIEQFVDSNPHTRDGQIIVNDGSIGFLELFAMYIALLTVYRVVFGGLHLLKFKCLRILSQKYRAIEFDLHEEFRKLRQDATDWNESLISNDQDKLESFTVVEDDRRLTLLSQVVGERQSRYKSKAEIDDRTCMDTDDDDQEFEEAIEEEEKDSNVNNVSAYMVAKPDAIRYMHDCSMISGSEHMSYSN